MLDATALQAAAWWEQAHALCQSHPQVACYQVAVLEEVPSFFRGMVVGGMKRGTPAAERGSFATVFENEAAWKQTFAFNAPNDAYLGLFDKRGKLLWYMSGGRRPTPPFFCPPSPPIASSCCYERERVIA